MNLLIKEPSAWIPIVLSLGMMAFIVTYISIFGIAAPSPDADEGTPAHIFQLWLGLEALMIGYFAIRWFPQRPMGYASAGQATKSADSPVDGPRQALVVLAFQILAVLAACAPVFYFEL